jgi:acyl transferase domain-containing protein
VLGASLGTFVAAALSGRMSAEDTLRLVVKQAGLVQRHCEPGGMIAVLAERRVLGELGLDRHAEIASENFESHFVLSAPAASLARIETLLLEREILHQRLPVGFAFHSRWVEGAGEALRASFGSLHADIGTIPMACTVRAEWLSALSAEYLWDVTRQPIAFQRVMRWLESSGPHTYVDVSPTGTLATLSRNIIPRASSSRVRAALSPFGDDLKRFRSVADELARMPRLAPAGRAAS